MNQEAQEKLEVSKDIVEQLSTMVRSSAAHGGYNQAPRTPGPSPSPSSNVRSDSDD